VKLVNTNIYHCRFHGQQAAATYADLSAREVPIMAPKKAQQHEPVLTEVQQREVDEAARLKRRAVEAGVRTRAAVRLRRRRRACLRACVRALRGQEAARIDA
jgi:hypothetical protein